MPLCASMDSLPNMSSMTTDKRGEFRLEVIRHEDDDGVYHDITLHYTDGDLNVAFAPEDPDHIKSVNLDKGIFDTSPSNGSFGLSWSGKVIMIDVARYGDGQGGSTTTTIAKTPERMESLMACLKQWQALY